mmetsp:Transcript_68047/g.61168  ORF Transcript_68047/g.61168 Transcript_68047/m.61168 type:complete len:309 (-) Transcript_68047:219-1145(-)
MTYYDTRLAFGIIFITINFCILCVTLLELYRSRSLFSSFSLHKSKLMTRLSTFFLAVLLLTLAFLDVDFWLYDKDRNVPGGIFIINIIIKAFIDMTICVTGSMIVYSIIYTYFISQFPDTFEEDFPSHVPKFWYSVSISFTFIVVLSLIISFAIDEFILIRIYSDVRLFYLFLACLYVSYTMYVLSMFDNQATSKYKRNSILLFAFSVLSFIGGVLSIIYTITQAPWDIERVVKGNLQESEQENDAGQWFGRFFIILIGWMGYWVCVCWFISIVWAPKSSQTSREIHTQNSIGISTRSPSSEFADSQK